MLLTNRGQSFVDSKSKMLKWGNYVATSALTPDGGLINGVGALSQKKHLRVYSISGHFDCIPHPVQI